MSFTKETKVNLTEIQKETLKEKIFRIFAVFIIILFPLALLMCFRVVKQYKRAIILRFGRVRADSPAGPGIIWIVPCTDSMLLVDLRTHSLSLPPQEILTKDSVTVTVDAVVYFHVMKPLNCVLNVQSHTFSTEMIAVATLRNILCQYTLTEVLTNRENISRVAKREIEKVTSEWGVEMERVEIKDVILPFELQKAMAAEAEGARLAKAKIIEAEGEIKAAENLKAASRIMMENPQVMMFDTKENILAMTSEDSTGSTNITQPANETTGALVVPESTKQESPLPERGTETPGRLELEGLLGSKQTSIENFRVRLQADRGHEKCIEKLLVFMSYLLLIICFPLSLFCIFVVVRQFERAVILRNGKVYKTKHLVQVSFISCLVSTSSSLLTFGLFVTPYHLKRTSTQYLAATTLRNAIGTKKMSELLTDRPAVSNLVSQHMKHFAREWGIHVVRVEIKDISLPLQLQKAMAAEAESSRLANAKIIVAKSEIESTKNLQKATTLLMDNPLCMQLRYLQSLHMIAGDKTHTIVFPFSVETIKKMFK